MGHPSHARDHRPHRPAARRFAPAELEARLSEHGVARGSDTRLHLDPHVLTDAVNQLKALGIVAEYERVTKGGATAPLLIPGDTTGRATYVLRAARRKGMLYARYRRLAAHQMGGAGEAILRRSLTEAGRHLIPVEPEFGEARRLLDVSLNGPLDSAAFLLIVGKTAGVPEVLTVPMEMKNRRLTIYPTHKEIHQLLAKAAALQLAHPAHPIVPVLVCRRAHSRLFWMAKDLGFLVHNTGRQYTTLPKETTAAQVEQVRRELGLTDLTIVDDKTPLIREFFREILPNRAQRQAARWAVTAGIVQPYADELREEGPSPIDRQDRIRELRQEVQPVLENAGFVDNLLTWSLPDLEE